MKDQAMTPDERIAEYLQMRLTTWRHALGEKPVSVTVSLGPEECERLIELLRTPKHVAGIDPGTDGGSVEVTVRAKREAEQTR